MVNDREKDLFRISIRRTVVPVVKTMTLFEELGALQRQDTEMVSLEMSSCHQECSDKKRKLVLKDPFLVVTAPTSLLSLPPYSGSMVHQGRTMDILGWKNASSNMNVKPRIFH